MDIYIYIIFIYIPFISYDIPILSCCTQVSMFKPYEAQMVVWSLAPSLRLEFGCHDGTTMRRCRANQLGQGKATAALQDGKYRSRTYRFLENIQNMYRYGGFLKWEKPQNRWFIRENPTKMDDLGLFQETTICTEILSVCTVDGRTVISSGG